MEVWIGRQGERHGPYQEEQVREWLRGGQLGRDDLGWYDGLADWQPLSVLFADEFSKAPPPYPPAANAAPTYSRPSTVVSYAGFWKRVVAYLIDAFVLYFPFSLLELPFGMRKAYEVLNQKVMSADTDPQTALEAYQHFYIEQWPYFLTTLVVGWLYFAVCESSSWQATIGKLALGMRVTDLHGARISFARALGRYGGKLISGFMLCIGFLMVAFTQRKQGLHDMLANTLVLNGRASDVNRHAPPPTQHDKTSFSA
ncbi:RDD family protein [Dyella psychrodurans]|uniref:RDD family protein n=1 Tax=Dyella psychrodurans TaxID=1927960 RepID=A0A370X7Z1_9GAMM|nr:RDD family protein [Dyella psychrodurans]RDS84335.1 RDD family protein [Dyella psychrodurans]